MIKKHQKLVFEASILKSHSELKVSLVSKIFYFYFNVFKRMISF